LKRRRTSDAYNIDNLVVPVLSGHQFEVATLKYREIYVPKWKEKKHPNLSSFESDGEVYSNFFFFFSFLNFSSHSLNNFE